MKKLYLILSLCFLFAGVETFGQASYDKGDVLLNFGFGAGYYYAGGTPIIASADIMLNDAFSVGPYVGFTSWGYRSFGYKWNYTFIDFGARGAYHFSKHLNMNTDKLDLYGGVILGFVVSSFDDNTGTPYTDPYGSTLRGGIVGGARYYFGNSFGVNGEVGLGGMTPLLLGITFKL